MQRKTPAPSYFGRQAFCHSSSISVGELITAQSNRDICRHRRLEHTHRSSIHQSLEFRASAFMVVLDIQSQTPTKQPHTGET